MNHAELDLRIGHRNRVESVAISPDLRTVASGSCDGTVKLWDVESGTLRKTIPEGWESVPSMAFSADSRFLAVAGWIRTPESAAESTCSVGLRIYDLDTGELLDSFEGFGHLVAFSPTGDALIAADYDELAAWHWPTRERKWTVSDLCEEGNQPYLLCVSGDGALIAVSGWQLIWVFNARDGSLLQKLQLEEESKVGPVCFLPDNETIAAIPMALNRDPEMLLWDARTGELKGKSAKPLEDSRWLCHDDPITAAFSRDERFVVAAGGGILQWDVQTGKLRRWLPNREYWGLSRALAFSSCGKVLASGGDDMAVTLWDEESKERLRVFGDIVHAVHTIALSPDGALLASAGTDGAIRLWDIHSGRLRRIIPADSGTVVFVEFLPNGRAVVGASSDGRVGVWDVETGSRLRTFVPHFNGLKSASLSSDGTRIVTCEYVKFVSRPQIQQMGKVSIWSLQSGELLWSCKDFPSPAVSAAFLADGSRLVIACTGHLLEGRLDGKTTTVRKEFKCQANFVVSGPDKASIAVGNWSNTVPILDVGTWRTRRRLTGRPGDGHTSVAFSPDGQMAVVCTCYYDWISLFDVESEKLIRNLPGQNNFTSSVFSPDSRLLAAGSSDGTVRLWQPQDGKLLATLMIVPPEEEHQVSTEWIVYTPEGYYQASSGAERFIRWRVGAEVLPAAAFEQQFRRPDKLCEALPTWSLATSENEQEDSRHRFG